MKYPRLRDPSCFLPALASVLLATSISSCRPAGAGDADPCSAAGANPCFVVHKVEMQETDGFRVTSYADRTIHSTAGMSGVFPDSTLGDGPPTVEPGPQAFKYPEKDSVVLVTLIDNVRMPHFPEPDHARPRTDPVNLELLARADSLVGVIKRQRLRSEGEMLAGAEDMQIEILERFWLINGFLVRTPRKNIPILRSRPNVLYVDPPFLLVRELNEHSVVLLDSTIHSHLAGYTTPTNPPVAAGRAFIGSETYYQLPALRGGWMALLDTGLNFSHLQLSSPSPVNAQGDCVRGGPTCLDKNPFFNPGEACGFEPHGTSTAAIVTANSNQGDSLRGVTNVSLDSFRIFSCQSDVFGDPIVFLDYAAAVRGFQAAVRGLDKVLISEMQGVPRECLNENGKCLLRNGRIEWEDHPSYLHGIISHAADRAFDAGTAVISAVGNTARHASQPGNAHKVIGVGSIDVVSGTTDFSSQGHGPTPDGRIKPDIQGPTGTVTASGLTDVWLNEHAATSGATPYVAAAAELYRNWMKWTLKADTTGWTARPIDPGQVYAQIILSGESSYPFHDSTGAGSLRMMPLEGEAFWGKVVLDSTGVVVDVPLRVSMEGIDRIDAAIWWPEDFGQDHRFVSLRIVHPDGEPGPISNAPMSVFQKTALVGPHEAGDWTLRLSAESVRNSAQVVYWAAHVR